MPSSLRRKLVWLAIILFGISSISWSGMQGFPVLSEQPDLVTTVRITHYWPPNGGINCYDYRDGWCQSPTASGIPWEAVIGYGAACPPEWPLGSVVRFPTGESFTCFDRGGEIKCLNDGTCRLDILSPWFPDGVRENVAVYFPYPFHRQAP